ncbi:Uncharacterised protein [Oligella ureolytica]|uniref:Chalcone isomerase domain-containing protein n=1 Tax=Oligella ureolytica TaxID=90244 RepID=A0A379B073_9BURK|nr:hypothetical protein [Oligella ureolytica]SUB29805.1 Uncharacterised protein [Oligella ureolytica]
MIKKYRGFTLTAFAIFSAVFFINQTAMSNTLINKEVVMTSNITINQNTFPVPNTHYQVMSRSEMADKEPIVLTRYERKDGRNRGLEGEHFSTIYADNGLLKGFANISLDLVSLPLPTREESEKIARDFLQEYAPDLLPRMEISWIDPHDEPILSLNDKGEKETHTVTGMKVKAKNTKDGRWFWVIVGADSQPMIFERDIVWISFPGHRQTEKWLHDSWLKKQK